MDTTAFNMAKDEIRKQLDTILSGAGDDLKVLANRIPGSGVQNSNGDLQVHPNPREFRTPEKTVGCETAVGYGYEMLSGYRC